MCCCQYMTRSNKCTAALPTEFTKIVRIANQDNPRPSTYMFPKKMYLSFSEKKTKIYKQPGLPITAGTPPTTLLCVPFEKPQPSSGDSNRAERGDVDGRRVVVVEVVVVVSPNNSSKSIGLFGQQTYL